MIRQEQMAALERAALESFIRRQAQRLSSKYSRTEGHGELERFVRQGIAAAREFNIKRTGNLEFFLDLTFDLGDEFLQSPVYRRILEDWRIPETEKINLLSEMRIFGNGR